LFYKSSNLKDARKETNLSIIGTVPTTMVSKNVAINIGIANLFTDADVQSDYIISEKVGYFTAGGAFDVLNIEASSVAKTPSYVTYLNSDLVVKSNKGSTRTLIPAIDINKSTGVSDPMVTSEMMYQVSDN
jgi:hypothetical protein